MLVILSPLIIYAHNQQRFRRHESAWMTEYLWVSKMGLWVDRSIAHMQRVHFPQFHASVSGFWAFFNHSFARGRLLQNHV